ncbi:MAG: response regulator [Anaerolineae bacterium]|nr:response regulator [Anaerolineae bacterium]
MVRILLVEDQASLRRLVGEVLEFSGYQVTAVADGRDALGLLYSGEVCPDLILSDLLMDSLGGAELLDAVRSEWLWRDIAFVMMSGQDQLVALGEQLRHEVDGYIAKPFGIKEILGAVQQALARHQNKDTDQPNDLPGDAQRLA